MHVLQQCVPSTCVRVSQSPPHSMLDLVMVSHLYQHGCPGQESPVSDMDYRLEHRDSDWETAWDGWNGLGWAGLCVHHCVHCIVQGCVDVCCVLTDVGSIRASLAWTGLISLSLSLLLLIDWSVCNHWPYTPLGLPHIHCTLQYAFVITNIFKCHQLFISFSTEGWNI